MRLLENAPKLNTGSSNGPKAELSGQQMADDKY